jgi:DNA-binding NtrC family response regulator
MSSVLVLVPENNVRELRRLVLAHAGFEVVAPEMSAALGMMEAATFDALVVSRVEDAIGCELIAVFRRRNPEGHVVVVGAQGRTRLLANAIVDPFDPAALISALRSAPGKSAGAY